jgi:hypothetical protein
MRCGTVHKCQLDGDYREREKPRNQGAAWCITSSHISESAIFDPVDAEILTTTSKNTASLIDEFLSCLEQARRGGGVIQNRDP